VQVQCLCDTRASYFGEALFHGADLYENYTPTTQKSKNIGYSSLSGDCIKGNVKSGVWMV